MIHHISFAARDPERVASVFAELLDGFSFPFPPNPGSFLAAARDGRGTGVEVHPADVVLEPGPQQARFAKTGAAASPSAVHFALSVDVERARIEEIGAREGWAVRSESRGGDFDVIELWVENRFLVELMPPAEAARYLAFCARMTDATRAREEMASHAP